MPAIPKPPVKRKVDTSEPAIRITVNIEEINNDESYPIPQNVGIESMPVSAVIEGIQEKQRELVATGKLPDVIPEETQHDMEKQAFSQAAVNVALQAVLMFAMENKIPPMLVYYEFASKLKMLSQWTSEAGHADKVKDIIAKAFDKEE
jgi:hypothetical protein